MSYLLNCFYLVFLLIISPWLLYKSITTGKYRRGMWRKLTGNGLLRADAAPCAWFHGVSVGEIHLLRQVIGAFRRRHPTWTCVVSTTTDTGFDEARKRFPDLPVFFWPLDFSWAVKRAIRQVRPDLIVLAEGELWPNFLSAAKHLGVPIVVVNGRMSPRSFQRYRLLGWLTRRLWKRIDLLAVQTEEYAAHFRTLGVPAECVHVTGSVKYDGVEADRNNPRTEHLRRLLGIEPDQMVWIAGSTQAPEEEIVASIYRRLRERHPHLRLIVVPRQKDRFDAVAAILRRTGEPLLRRSELVEKTSPPQPKAEAYADHPLTPSPPHPIILVDTVGELGALWGLADVAFVGGSLDGLRGGQNMIEPAAYGAAVLFGPHVWNFHDTAARLVAADAAIEVPDPSTLEAKVGRLVDDPAQRNRLGQAARSFVASQHGATNRTIDLIDRVLSYRHSQEKAA